MKVSFSNRGPVTWRIDDDGLMRVTLCILKEGVYEYGVEEVPDQLKAQGKDTIFEYVPKEELARPLALSSVEGKPVLKGKHDWRKGDSDMGDGLTVGAIAGQAYAKDGMLFVDAVIYDDETREAIKRGDLVEVSAAYDGDLEIQSGAFGRKFFDAIQKNFRFNHVALLPSGAGRCGEDVRIINTKSRAKMAESTLKVRIGNSMKTYRFSNEDDRQEAEEMLEEQKAFNAEEVAAAIEEKDKLQAQIDELQAQLAEHDKHLAEAKAEIERHMSAEYQEELAQEAAEQTADEDEIIVDAAAAELEDQVENEGLEEECKEKIKNAIRKGTFANRRRNAVAYVFANQHKTEIPASWDQAAIDGAFEALVMSARMRNSARAKGQRVLNGKLSVSNKTRIANTTRERMLRPMQVRNGKEVK